MRTPNFNPGDFMRNHQVVGKFPLKQKGQSQKSLSGYVMLTVFSLCFLVSQVYGQQSCYTFSQKARNNPLKAFVVTSASESHPFFVDIDGDGDLDCFAGEYSGRNDAHIIFLKNNGNNAKPKFEAAAKINPLSEAITGTVSYPFFVDIDADGDYDCFIGDGKFGALVYYKNIGTKQSPSFEKQAAGYNPLRMVKSSTTDQAEPAFADIDGDGDFDCVVTDLYGDEYFYKNIGNAQEPQFEKMSGKDDPFSFMKDFEATGISFYDWNNDGLTDLFVGTKYYQNYGSKTAPLFLRNENQSPVFDTKNDLYPIRWADLNSDGFIDAISGTPSGKFLYLTTAPDVYITPDIKQSVNAGKNVKLTAYPQSKDFNYQWTKDGKVIQGASGNILETTSEGNYSVAVRSSCGSSSTDEVSLVSSNGKSLSAASSNESVKKEEKVQIYPNPAKSEFTLVKVGANSNAQQIFKVTDMLGRIVLTQQMPGEVTLKFGKTLPSGIYYFQIYEGDKIVYTEKIIKQ